MHAVYAAIAKLTFIDPYILVRFIGPIMGAMIVLAIYYVAYKTTHNRYAALFAMTIYGLTDFELSNLNYFPSQLYRQAATMPQEFAMLFILVGLGFLIDYLNDKRKNKLFFYLACMFMAFMVHSYAALYVVFWSAVLIMFALIFRTITLKDCGKLTMVSVIVIAITFIPLLIGRLSGAEFHTTSIEMITAVTNFKSTATLTWGHFFKSVLFLPDPYMFVVVIGILLVPVVMIIPTIKYGLAQKRNYLFLSLSAFLTFLLFNTSSLFPNFQLPELLNEYRIGPFLCMVVSILIAQLADFIAILVAGFKKKTQIDGTSQTVVNTLFALAAIAYIIIMFPLHTFPGDVSYKNVIEYDSAAQNYLKIKKQFFNNSRSLDWTVIAPNEQLAEVMGFGWDSDIYRFVREYSPTQVAKADFQFPIPTHDIFVFIEKKPLFYGKLISLNDAEKTLQPEGDDPFMEYYMNGNQRAIVEAKAWALVEAYKSSHSGVSVFYKDANLEIYQIHQTALPHGATSAQ